MKRKIAIALSTLMLFNTTPIYAANEVVTSTYKNEIQNPRFNYYGRNPYFEILWYISNTDSVSTLFMHDISNPVELAKELGITRYYSELEVNPENFIHSGGDLSFVNREIDTSNVSLGPYYSSSEVILAPTYGDLKTLDMLGVNCALMGVPLNTEGFQDLINEAKGHSSKIDFVEPLRKVYDGLHDMDIKKAPSDFKVPLNDVNTFSKLPKGISGYTLTVYQDEFDNTLPKDWIDNAVSSNSHMTIYVSDRVSAKGENKVTTTGYDISDLFTDEQLKKLTKVEISSGYGDTTTTNTVSKVKSRKTVILSKEPSSSTFISLTFSNRVRVRIKVLTEQAHQYGYEVKSESGEILYRATAPNSNTLTYKSPGVTLNGTFDLYEEPQFINKITINNTIPEDKYSSDYGFNCETVYLKYTPDSGDTRYIIKSEDGSRVIETRDVAIDSPMGDMPIDPQLDKNRAQVGISYEANSDKYVAWPTKNYSSNRGENKPITGYIVTEQKPKVNNQGVYEGMPNTIQLNFDKKLFSKIDDTDISNFIVKINSEPVSVTSVMDSTDYGFRLVLSDRIYKDDKVEVIINCDKIYQETKTISNNTTTERPAEYLSSVVGGSAPTGQVKLNLNKALTFDLSLTDASDFRLTADNKPIPIVDVSASTGDRSVALYYTEDMYKGQDIKLSYNGDKIVRFSNEQVTNLLTTPNPTPSKPSIISAVTENDTPNKISITLTGQPSGDVTTTSNWSLVVNSKPATINSASISDRVITVEMADALQFGDIANITYSGDNIQGISAYPVQNNVQKIEKPKYISSETKDSTSIEITLDKEVEQDITQDKQDFNVLVNDSPAVINEIQQNSTKITVVLTQPISNGDTIKISYTGDKIENFSDEIVNNTVPEQIELKRAYISKDSKNKINLVFNKSLNEEITIADASDFVINKNGTPIEELDITNISKDGTNIIIELNEDATSTDEFTISYNGSKFNTFQEYLVVNNIKPQILNGAINADDGVTITLTLDESLGTDLNNIKDFNIFVNGLSYPISNIEGNTGDSNITIMLDKRVYANDRIELTYTGKDLVQVNNLNIHNSTTEPKPKLQIRDSYIQGGYISDTVVVIMNDNIELRQRNSSLSDNFEILLEDGTKPNILSEQVKGNQIQFEIDKNLNYKHNIKVNITGSDKFEDTQEYEVQNRLWQVGGLDIDNDGNIILPGGAVVIPNLPTIPPIVDEDNSTVTIPGGITKPEDNDSGKIEIEDDVIIDTDSGLVDAGNGTTVDIDNGSVTLPDGSTVEPENGGDINIGGGNINLPNGGTITYPDGSTKPTNPGEVIDPTNPPTNNGGNNNGGNNNGGGNSNGGNNQSSGSSGGGAVIGTTPGSNSNNNSNNTTSNNNNSNSNSSSWADDILNNLEENNIINKADYIDNISTPITREHFAKLIVSMLENSFEDKLEPSPNTFNDLSDNDSPLLKLNSINVFEGYNDGTIKPDNLITREETAVVVAKLSKHLDISKINEGTPIYQDNSSIRWWSKSYITEAFQYNIMLGDENNNFNPQDNLATGEALSIINQYIKR